MSAVDTSSALTRVRQSLQRTAAVAVKELRQLRRDRLTVGMVIGIPLMQILIFGYGINFDVRHIAAGYVDQANTQASRALLADLQASQVVDFKLRAGSVAALRQQIAAGEISAGLYIPADFPRRLQDARPAAQLFIDAGEPGIEGVLRALTRVPVATRPIYAALGEGAQRRTTSRAAHEEIEVFTEFNPERRTAVQIVPALIGVILHLTMVIFTSLALVRERERGNLELLITTPVGSAELMLGKLSPYVLVGLLQTSIILATGAWIFDVPINGSLVDLYAGALLFIASALALGLFMSTLAETQFQAMQLGLLTMLPSILLSGFMFPFDGMPVPVQWVAQLLPLTHFTDIVRGIVLRGATLTELWLPAVKLAGLLVLLVGLAAMRFRKRLD